MGFITADQSGRVGGASTPPHPVEAADSPGPAGPWCYLNLLGWGFFCTWGCASPRFVAFSDGSMFVCSLWNRLFGVSSCLFARSSPPQRERPRKYGYLSHFLCFVMSRAWTLAADLMVVGDLADPLPPFFPFFLFLPSFFLTYFLAFLSLSSYVPLGCTGTRSQLVLTIFL